MKKSDSISLKIHLVLILVSCLFGVNYVFSKYVLQYVPPAAWALGRVFFTALFLFIWILPRFKRHPPTGRQWLGIMYVGFFGVVLNQISFFEGLSRTTATHSAIINTTIPIFVLFFSLVLGYEKFNWTGFAGMALSVIGVLTVLGIENQHFDSTLFLGDLLSLCNSMCFGLYLVLSKKLNREVDPMVVTAGMFFIGTIGMAIYGGQSALHVPWGAFPLAVYGAMAYIVLGASIGTYSLNNWALSKTDSTMVALYIYIQPIMAGFLSRLIYHEDVSLRMVIASLLVFMGVAIGSLRWQKKEELYVQYKP